MQHSESSAKGEKHSCWKTRKISSQQPDLQLRELEKEEQTKSEASRRKEIKIRVEMK